MIVLNHWNQDSYPSTHVQNPFSALQRGGRDNLVQTFHHVRWLWSIEDIYQFIETAALVSCDLSHFLLLHVASDRSLTAMCPERRPTHQNSALSNSSLVRKTWQRMLSARGNVSASGGIST